MIKLLINQKGITLINVILILLIFIIGAILFKIIINGNSIENITLSKDNFQGTLKEYANNEYSNTEGASDDLAYVMYAIFNYSMIDSMSNNFEFDDQLTIIYGKTINELKKEGKELMKKNDVQIETFKIYLRSVNKRYIDNL